MGVFKFSMFEEVKIIELKLVFCDYHHLPGLIAESQAMKHAWV